jgi:hypothetical protein
MKQVASYIVWFYLAVATLNKGNILHPMLDNRFNQRWLILGNLCAVQ